MPRKKSKAADASPPAEVRWAIYRVKQTPATFIGFVQAPDEATATARGADLYQVPGNWRDRLVALRDPAP